MIDLLHERCDRCMHEGNGKFVVTEKLPKLCLNDMGVTKTLPLQALRAGRARVAVYDCSSSCGYTVLRSAPGLSYNTISPAPSAARSKKVVSAVQPAV